MNKQAILSSIFLGLALPAVALAKVPTQNLNQEQFNTSGVVTLAQRNLTPQYVAARLNSSKARILNMAREYSGSQASWNDISVEIISNQRIKLNVLGKIPRGWPIRDPNIRIGLYLQRDSQGGFRVVSYDWRVWGGRCEAVCMNKVRSKLRNLPNEYPRFQRLLNSILS